MFWAAVGAACGFCVAADAALAGQRFWVAVGIASGTLNALFFIMHAVAS